MFFKSAVLYLSVAGVGAVEEKIKLFTPATKAALSYDKTIVTSLLYAETDESFDSALSVYMSGGNSKSMAELTVKGGLPVAIPKLTKLTAKGMDGRDVTGVAETDYAVGDSVIHFLYPVKDSLEDPSDCRVGGLPKSRQVTNGCLVESGKVFIHNVDDPISYEYKVDENNINGRTVADLSTLAHSRMRPSPDADFFQVFQPFVDYYGTADYAHEIINAAFHDGSTHFLNGNFRDYLSDTAYEARLEIIDKGIAILSAGMYALKQLEEAVYNCDQKCKDGDCSDTTTALHALDIGVALYVGASDNLFFDAANRQCAHFATCHGDNPSEGVAHVNSKIFIHFMQMQSFLQQGKCDDARPLVNSIASQMWVPLIQGILRYSWILTDQNPDSLITSKAHQASGATYAAAILPMIHQCNPEAANLIHENMKIRNTNVNVDFKAVREALEGCYEHLGVTCDDVGGLVSGISDEGVVKYHELTQPCDHITPAEASGSKSTPSKKSSSGRKTFGYILLVIILAGGCRYMFYRKKQLEKSSRNEAKFDPNTPEQPLDKAELA
eukprot:scaffold2204_cov166-Amphora_coffeaeformis.AAC.2